jgi:twitching motility two-component system response regulator PilG
VSAVALQPETPAVGFPHAGVRVMVIDDSHTIRHSAQIFLQQMGCKVILAADGFEALVEIEDQRPDLILVDVLMPRLDGYQTCTLIKKSSRHKATPVIMLSSKDTVFDRVRGRMAGSDAYLDKPFTKQELLEAVTRTRCAARPRELPTEVHEGVSRK